MGSTHILYTTPHYTTLHHSTAHYTTAQHTTPQHSTLHHSTAHCTALHYITIYYRTLHITRDHNANHYPLTLYRHGHRLDAADKQWHLTSPTPYDPPLTYGGWMHSRTVGARIAAVLRDEASESLVSTSTSSSSPSPSPSPSPSHSHPRKRRRFRIILHSSPFIRCVQTSIAISAGLASNPAPSSTTSTTSTNLADSSPPPTQAGTLRSTQTSYFPNPAPTKTRPDVPIPTSASSHDTSSDPPKRIEKAVLRLDAFLGEWLSPDYFEHITPPPKSALMLATAKAELLRRSSYHDYPHFHVRVHSTASSQLWGNLSSHHAIPGTPPVHGPHSISSLDTLSHLAHSLPGYEGGPNGHLDSKGAHEHHQGPGYVFPVPSYAISTSEPIPKGYVAHARDDCVSIDYQWDSSRDNLAWGDGGTLPEEWAAMHQRFRKGLRRLVDWYGSTENAGEMVTRTAHISHPPEPDCAIGGEEDGDIEDVVVLVSHGAGCNALIGALTQQPVLADIAMSSLTIAKRRADFDSRNISLTREKSFTSLHAALPMSRAKMPEIYELKLFANTDHLSTPSPSRSTSLAVPSPRARGSTGFTSALKEINFGSLYGGSPGGSPRHSPNASLGNMRRPPGSPSLVIGPSVYNENTGGITVGSGTSGFSVTRPDRSGSGTWGLWSPSQEDNEHEKESEEPMFLDFSHEKSIKDKDVKNTTVKDEKSATLIDADKLTDTTTTFDQKRTSTNRDQDETWRHQHDEENDVFDEDPVPRLWGGTGNGGLWGAPRLPGEAERLRDFSLSKRRWTVTER
ncbi:hypothetical protein E0Z10_g8839 [Xylaria hypoxylon]|uniref:Phosphoglycerate mutase n=1 Tax=Xylaria hypoxylon TaxID=37992 RepID=A0A4Z0YIQ5_9PEZI|nr:hypothetical protein E0Z10_g8839 [Xylaria hypoxylon]